MRSRKVDFKLMEAGRELFPGETDLQSKGQRIAKGTEYSLAGVIGYPVQHSLSPYIFNWLSQRDEKKVAYYPISIPPASLSEGPSRLEWMLRTLPFVGVNVTIPYKETVLQCLDSISPEAQSVGAINVIQKKGDVLIGHNTDVYGILASLKEAGATEKVRGKTALLLGAGGAARAAAYVLGQLGAARVLTYNRTPARAQRLCRDFGSLFPGTIYISAGEREIALEGKDLTLIIQATPDGKVGVGHLLTSFGNKGASSPANDGGSSNQKVWAFDMVYRPQITGFLEWALNQKMNTIHGLNMLIWQALATWEIWFGNSDDRASIGDAKRQILKASLCVDLEGYIGILGV